MRRVVKETLEERDVEDHFFGPNFGRFNYSVEFCRHSAKVASNIVCDIQDSLKSSLEQKWKTIEVCSSVILGTEMLDGPSQPDRFEQAIRAYTTIKPCHGRLFPFVETVQALNSQEPRHTQMRILWTHGVHWILTISGPCCEGIFSKLERFRNMMEEDYINTSTCISLNNKNDTFFDEQDQTNRTHTHSPKYALVYVKQLGADPLKLEGLKPLSILPDLSTEIKRLGGHDTVLVFRENSLGDIMSNVRKLRALNIGWISRTNTVLLYK